MSALLPLLSLRSQKLETGIYVVGRKDFGALIHNAQATDSTHDPPNGRRCALPGDGNKRQPIRVVVTQLLHLSLVHPQHLQHLRVQWCDPLSVYWSSPSCDGLRNSHHTQALADQQLPFSPANADPVQTPDFGISQPFAQPKQKQRVTPTLIVLQVSKHHLDCIHSQNIALQRPPLSLERVRTKMAVMGHQASDGAAAQATLFSQPGEGSLCIASVADGLSISLQQLVE